ncbi:hypothetical protein K1F50_01595 [Muricauda oceani]|uniref:Uncharacterized protein n=1 Tax=Flagellimonas oceani TaxID=2698672 RepID=A0A6G7J1N4_9FLAO|nr:hypothetical protein [Allomuricauda oceani]MBW8241475.1 hypothetical protein [Allomuricauda oceani]QII44529.1 hypothetical protein GVT53_07515 [Allomuricauda oceani]
MGVKFIKIFIDEMVTLEKLDGERIQGIIQSSKNDIQQIEGLSTDLQDLHEILFTVKLEGKERLDLPIKLKDIHSIERMD